MSRSAHPIISKHVHSQSSCLVTFASAATSLVVAMVSGQWGHFVWL